MKFRLLPNRNNIFLKIYIALLFAFLTVFALGPMKTSGKLVCFLLIAIGWYLVAEVALRLFHPLQKWSAKRCPRLGAFLDSLRPLQLFLLFWGILTLLWLPTYLALFPGTFGYDAPVQWRQYIGIVDMTDHHPVLHTWLLGFLISLGRAIFGNYNGGLALYTAIQALIVTGSLAYLLLMLKTHRAHPLFLVATCLWLGLNPFLQIISFNCTKDVLFGAFFMDFLLSLFHLYYGGKEKASLRQVILLSLFGLLSCLFRHQGVYIIVVLLIFCLFYKLHRRAILISFLSILFLTEGFGFCCHNLWGYEPSDSREMLSVPMQQMAYVCKDKINGGIAKVSEEQLATVETFIPAEGILSYSYTSADPVKYTFRTDVFFDDFGKNLSTYLELGLHNFGAYRDAFQRMTAPYFSAKQYSVRSLMIEYTFVNSYPQNFHRHSLLPGYYHYLVDATTKRQYPMFPGGFLLFNPNLCTWLAFVALGVAIQKKSRKKFLLILPILLFFATLLLGPVALIRYVYPLIMLTPLVTFLIVSEEPV